MSVRLLIFVGVVLGASSLAAAGYYFYGPRGATTPTPKPIQELAQNVDKPKKSLANFHGEAVRAFVNTPGFGRGRMMRMRSEIEEIYVHFSPGELDAGDPPIDVPDLAKAHQKSRRVFTTEPRKEAVGLPYTVMSYHYDLPSQAWRLDNVNLLAIVEHETPTVYLTNKLFLMEQLHDRPASASVDKASASRDLDFFELAGLEKLTAGEELVVRTKDNHLRVLGALRADKSCLECHEAKEGDLFGAFTYTLTKVNY